MGGPWDDNPPFWGRRMDSQPSVTSEIILSIYSRGTQRRRVICPERESDLPTVTEQNPNQKLGLRTPSPVLILPHVTPHGLHSRLCMR